jgi:hypothetical protein
LLKVCHSYSWYHFLAFPNSEKAKFPWKRDATNNFRVFVYIVTTYFIFIFPLVPRFPYKLKLDAKEFLDTNIKEIKLAKEFL